MDEICYGITGCAVDERLNQGPAYLGNLELA